MDLTEAVERIAVLEAENQELRERLSALERRLSLNSTKAQSRRVVKGFKRLLGGRKVSVPRVIAAAVGSPVIGVRR